jgi:hypothetical protein
MVTEAAMIDCIFRHLTDLGALPSNFADQKLS